MTFHQLLGLGEYVGGLDLGVGADLHEPDEGHVSLEPLFDGGHVWNGDLGSVLEGLVALICLDAVGGLVEQVVDFDMLLLADV